MGLITNLSLYYYKSIIISKIFLINLYTVPKIKKLSFFFIISKKQYKKNLLLFYIFVSLMFGGVLVLKKKEIQDYIVLKLSIAKIKIFIFFMNFINLYLPLFNPADNQIKFALLVSKAEKALVYGYRLSYSSLPLIPEFEVMYADCEMIYNFVNSYRFQLDIYIKVLFFINESFSFLVRLFRLPVVLRFKQIYF